MQLFLIRQVESETMFCLARLFVGPLIAPPSVMGVNSVLRCLGQRTETGT